MELIHGATGCGGKERVTRINFLCDGGAGAGGGGYLVTWFIIMLFGSLLCYLVHYYVIWFIIMLFVPKLVISYQLRWGRGIDSVFNPLVLRANMLGSFVSYSA